MFFNRLVVCLWLATSTAECAIGEELESARRLAESSAAADVDPAVLDAKLRRDLGFFADDAQVGRGVGTPGIEASANYIAESFAASGLRTDLFDGKPFQAVQIPISVSLGDAASNQLQFTPIATGDANQLTTRPLTNIDAELDVAFRPLAIGSSAKVQGDAVFVGFGITAPEFGYDDYAKVDVRGCVVILVRKEPLDSRGNPRFGRSKNSRHAYFETKVKNAAEHGAVGVLLVNDEESVRDAVAQVDFRINAETTRLNQLAKQLAELPESATNSRQAIRQRRDDATQMLQSLRTERTVSEDGLLEIGEGGESPAVKGVAVASLSRTVASKLLRAVGWDSIDDTIARIHRTGRPASTLLAHRAALATELSASVAKSANVLGVLEGKGDLAEQTVVVGAHYDHVGMGGYGSLAPGTFAIHNGADDNASGTSVALASADLVRDKLANVASHRRVVFIAFTGEERGLLGSQYYVRHPRFALESTVAMINLDMVGRLRGDDLTVYGTGTAIEFDALLDQVGEGLNFKFFKVPSGYGPSDHQSFYLAKIPVLFFFTGLHNDYHRPSDDIEKINFPGLARITELTAGAAAKLALVPTSPRYAQTDRDVSIRWQPTAYLGVQLQQAGGGLDGVVVSGVSPRSAAEVAGLRSGDRLRQVDGIPLRAISDLLELIRQREVDDPLQLQYVRDGVEQTTTAILKPRPE